MTTWSCACRDDGAGIDPDKVPGLLAGAGGGIGLANVDARLRATFGERYALRIESELGQGTTAIMTVPNLAGSSAESRRRLADGRDDGGIEQMSADQLTILAVDDEPTQLEDLARLLRALPGVREVECACDGHDALVKASAERLRRDLPRRADARPRRPGAGAGAAPVRRRRRSSCSSRPTTTRRPTRSSCTRSTTCASRSPAARVEEAVERVADAVRVRARGGEPRRDAAAASATGSRDDRGRRPARRRDATDRPRRIRYIQSYGDFVRVVTDDGRYLLRATLAEIEQRWARYGFVRVHRQYVANLRNAVELRPQLGGTAELAFAGGQTIPVARRHTAELGRLLSL